jgi:hypothetical protein
VERNRPGSCGAEDRSLQGPRGPGVPMWPRLPPRPFARARSEWLLLFFLGGGVQTGHRASVCTAHGARPHLQLKSTSDEDFLPGHGVGKRKLGLVSTHAPIQAPTPRALVPSPEET